MKRAGWQRKSRQQEGLVSEAKVIKEAGGRVHPRSGAGKIKWDGSNDDEVFEVKEVAKSHTLNGLYLERLLKDAVRQGKQAVYIITFREARIRVECRITRE